jgi:NAD(P)-dependent dehydrogenase (short-subunit alcohol dehydrogenase family)
MRKQQMAKTVLITGASSGIGRATAELMHRRGWQVAATARDPSSLGSMEIDRNALLLRMDVTDEASIAQAVPTVVDRFGGIDVLVNNAGYGVFGPLEGASPDEVERQFRTNVFGTIALIRHVMPIMRERRSAGRMAAPFMSLYHASKYAIEGLSDSLRYEASLHGIRIKLVEPGHFKTGFISRSLKLARHPDYEKPLRNYMEWVHLQDEKAPGPEPVAQAILRAAEDTSPKLRYPVRGTLVLALSRLLPDAMWRGLLGAGMTRRPKSARRDGEKAPE